MLKPKDPSGYYHVDYAVPLGNYYQLFFMPLCLKGYCHPGSAPPTQLPFVLATAPISVKLAYQYLAIFFISSPTASHLHPLPVENCDSNSRLVVDEDDNGKFRLERVNVITQKILIKPLFFL